jgi:uncharacterized protein (DUF924 family)
LKETSAADVIAFWFGPRARPLWFARNHDFDAEIRERFGGLAAEACAGKFASWESTAETALALILLVDQFPRNMHRTSPAAFAADPLCRGIAARAIERGFDLALPWDRRFFFYLPFEHSEQSSDQDRSVALFRAWVDGAPPDRRADAEDQFHYVLRHQEIIRRFGRFPHRNAVLGRPMTVEEEAFLREPRSSF